MKIIITEQQRKFISEIIKLDIKVGDVIMGGKFKNKKVVVKTISKNEKGDITINGKPLLRFRIIKENIMSVSRRGNITESIDNKRKHLYRRIGEIEDVLKEYEDLFIRTAKTLDKDGFIHATPMFIGDIIAGRLEEKGIDFDYVTFRNQITVFVKSHFYQELNDFYNKHKKPLTESEHLKGLLSELPPFLKRRVTMEDLEWMDGKLNEFMSNTPAVSKFDNFCDYALGDLLHEFLVDRKDDEIDTDNDPDYGLIYNDESFGKLSEMYWELKPFLKKRYEIRLRNAYNRKMKDYERRGTQ